MKLVFTSIVVLLLAGSSLADTYYTVGGLSWACASHLRLQLDALIGGEVEAFRRSHQRLADVFFGRRRDFDLGVTPDSHTVGAVDDVATEPNRVGAARCDP